jgi:hypothetical protein
MLNIISKYQKAIVGCSAIATVTLTGFVQSASAQTTPPTANGSNATGSNSSGSNVTGTITTGSNGSGSNGSGSTGRPGFSPTTISRAGALNSNISLKQGAYNTAAQNLAAAEAATPTVADTTPVRFARQALDAASCGCLNADTNASTNTTPRPELAAARAAEAQAAAELAAAKAEARQFLESVKGENTASNSSTTSVLW